MHPKDILLLNLSRFDHYIELANNKASWLITTLFTLFLGVIAFIGYSDIIQHVINENHIATCIFILSFLFLVFFNIQAFYYLTIVLNPNLKSNLSGDSIIFFGDIVKNGLPDFSKKIDNLDRDEIMEDLKEQVFVLSEIANIKYQNIIKVNNILICKIIPVSLIVCIFSLILKLIFKG